MLVSLLKSYTVICGALTGIKHIILVMLFLPLLMTALGALGHTCFLINLKFLVFFKSFFAYVDTQFHTKVQIIRTDNGTEFFNKEMNSLFDSLGIVHQHSCVETPQQNGRAERKYKHLLSVARALKFQSNVPIHLWGDCLLTATYIINKTPTSILDHKTPYEVLFHKSPSYKHMKIFGCLCYASTLHIRQDKFAPRAFKCVFLGYPQNQKGYKLLNLETGQHFVSRDVYFYESIFPYAQNSAQNVSHVLFPNEPSFIDTLIPLVKPFVSPFLTVDIHSDITHSTDTPCYEFVQTSSPVPSQSHTQSNIQSSTQSDIQSAPTQSDIHHYSRPSRTRVLP